MGTVIFCALIATATLAAWLKSGGLGMLLIAVMLLPATGLYVDVGVAIDSGSIGKRVSGDLADWCDVAHGAPEST